jgi:glycerate 2-kinase
MSEKIANLRTEALRLFQTAIKAADPAAALTRQFEARPITAPKGVLYVIAVGKAACPMIEQTLEHVPEGTQTRALAVTNRENLRKVDGVTVLPAGHPVPDIHGEVAGRAVIDLLAKTTADDRVSALISGGGSALLPAPIDGVSLADKALVSEILLGAGCDIEQMNEVRQQISKLKGGGFLRYAAPALVDAYILSDVVGDDLRAIASGPTTAPIGTKESARNILGNLEIFTQMPQSVQTALSTPETPQPPLPKAQNTLVCSNRQSLEAMQAASDIKAVIVNDHLEGNVAVVAPALVDIIRNMPLDTPLALIFGGETTVTLTGTGKGGRNQDLALRFALNARDLPGDWVFLSGGTDGRDGPTDAAGGMVDPTTVTRMKKAGQDPEALLNNNDAYTALAASNDLLMTGGTGTNVADVQVFLRA